MTITTRGTATVSAAPITVGDEGGDAAGGATGATACGTADLQEQPGQPVPSPARVAVAQVLWVVVPTLAACAAIAAFVLGEASGVNPFTHDPPRNISEAVTFGDGARALALIREGQDPSARAAVPQGDIDSRRALRVTPIEAALLTRRPEFVVLMLRHGAQPATPVRLACLAQAVGLDAEVPPPVFGLAGGAYYTGPPVGSIEALDACGIPSE